MPQHRPLRTLSGSLLTIHNTFYTKRAFRLPKQRYLTDKTFGVIVFKNATRKAIFLANNFGIRFLRLSNINVDYKKLRKSVEEEYKKDKK